MSDEDVYFLLLFGTILWLAFCFPLGGVLLLFHTLDLLTWVESSVIDAKAQVDVPTIRCIILYHGRAIAGESGVFCILLFSIPFCCMGCFHFHFIFPTKLKPSS